MATINVPKQIGERYGNENFDVNLIILLSNDKVREHDCGYDRICVPDYMFYNKNILRPSSKQLTSQMLNSHIRLNYSFKPVLIYYSFSFKSFMVLSPIVL